MIRQFTKIVFLAKIMLQLVPFQISFRRSKIELRKSTSFKSSKNCQFQHIFENIIRAIFEKKQTIGISLQIGYSHVGDIVMLVTYSLWQFKSDGDRI